MKKSIVCFFYAVFAMQTFSAETICTPYFELVEINSKFADSLANTLNESMQTNMEKRQLLMSIATDSVKVTDDFEYQTGWAMVKGCSYLLQTTLTNLGETIQVRASLVDLSSNLYVFKNDYNANSTNDLYPIFKQLGNVLQDDEFASTVEAIHDTTNSYDNNLTKKFSGYFIVSVDGSYNNKFNELYGASLGYFIDFKTFMAQLFYNMSSTPNNDYKISEIGIRFYYPFSNINNNFYLGSGFGFVSTDKFIDDEYSFRTNYGLIVEANAGYTFSNKNYTSIIRIEGFCNSVIPEASIGIGARIIIGMSDKIFF